MSGGSNIQDARRFSAFVYRNDEVQRTNQRERRPFQSHPCCKTLLLDIQRTTFSKFSFRWDQATSELICTIPNCPNGGRWFHVPRSHPVP
jgi:hypothetical protein